jgi:hypothetical protein
LIKRVGDGSSIRVFEDPWIPDNMNGRPLVRKPEAKATMVEELIDDNLMAWSEEKLEENFIETDKQAIQRIPLGRFSEDEWAWTQEKSGNFTARSAYRLLALNQRANVHSGSGEDTNTFWKKLWRVHVPPKVRSFCWRVIKRFIPVRLVLKERHIDHIAFCHECGAEESIFHALFECTWAKIFWEEMRRMADLKVSSFHPRSWAMDMVDNPLISESSTALIMCSCWAIWNERNACKHGEGGRLMTDSVRWALQTMVDLSRSSRKKAKKPPRPKGRWSPPIEGSLKIDTDASFFWNK